MKNNKFCYSGKLTCFIIYFRSTIRSRVLYTKFAQCIRFAGRWLIESSRTKRRLVSCWRRRQFYRERRNNCPPKRYIWKNFSANIRWMSRRNKLSSCKSKVLFCEFTKKIRIWIKFFLCSASPSDAFFKAFKRLLEVSQSVTEQIALEPENLALYFSINLFLNIFLLLKAGAISLIGRKIREHLYRIICFSST